MIQYKTMEQQDIQKYLESLDETQKQACKIAMEHLGSSFHIQRSNGFQEWKKSQDKKTQTNKSS
jgi:hypothetical protein